MTCDEILAQINELTGNFNAQNQTLESDQSNANSQYAAIIFQDNLGGTLPPIPLTAAGVYARMQYIGTLNLNPPPVFLPAYQTLWQLLEKIEQVDIPALQQTVTMMGEMKQQAVDQGCQQ